MISPVDKIYKTETKKANMKPATLKILFITVLSVASVEITFAQNKPLLSWNEGKSKKSIRFCIKDHKKGKCRFVPVSD